MQRVTLVRYTVKPNLVAENERLSRAVFDELRQAAPEHAAYAVFRNGADFVHIFINLRTDDSDAVTGLASFKSFSKDVAARSETPVEQTRLSLELLDCYGLSGASAADK